MANVSSSNGIEKYPKLRFPEFTESWTETQLSNLFKKNTKKNNEGSVTNVISNSAKNGLIPQKDYFDKDIANADNTSVYYIIRKNDFVYNPRKSTDAPYGPISRYTCSDDGIVSPLYLCFRGNDNVNPYYFEKYFKSSAWHRYIYMSGDSGARHDRVSIKDEIFFEMPINLPCEQEQDKIASFLSALERKIEKQAALVDNLKKYKRGLIQAVFNQKIRLTKSEENWQIYRIGDLLKICHGKDYKDISSQQKTYPVLGTGGVIDYVDEYICNWPCVLIGRKGTINKPQYMETPFWSVDTLFYSKPNKNQHPKFQFYLFQTINWQKYNEASGVPSLSSSTIEGIKVNVPNYETQAEISNIFSFIDCRIESTEKSLNNLLLLKKALLQQLFI